MVRYGIKFSWYHIASCKLRITKAMATYSSSFPFTTTATIDKAQATPMFAINVILSFIGTFGNFLIIFAVLKTPQLRQRPSNLLLASLAVADLVVTMVVQPLFTTGAALATFEGKCNPLLGYTQFTTGAFSCISSACHLAAVGIDRVISVVKPHRHHEIMKKWYKMMLVICWGTATLLAASLLVRSQVVNLFAQLFIMVCEVVMICSYGIILYKVKRSHQIAVTTSMSPSAASERAKENRLSGTIAIVIVLFAACWFPFIGISFVHRGGILCQYEAKICWVTTLLMANSSMNFIVYSLRIRQFRAAYMTIITRIFQRLRQVFGRCFCVSAKHRNIRVKEASVVPLSMSKTSLTNETQG